MEAKTIIELVVAVIAGVLTCIPLVIKLIEHVKACVKEKNWPEIMDLVMDLMAEAEKMFDDGETRKAWVLSQIEVVASHVEYDIDIAIISKMIDSMCAMSKTVNAPEVENAES